MLLQRRRIDNIYELPLIFKKSDRVRSQNAKGAASPLKLSQRSKLIYLLDQSIVVACQNNKCNIESSVCIKLQHAQFDDTEASGIGCRDQLSLFYKGAQRFFF